MHRIGRKRRLPPGDAIVRPQQCTFCSWLYSHHLKDIPPKNSGWVKMDPIVGNLISVGIGAFVTLLGVFLSNWLLIHKEREQWHRERKAEQEKWLRDKLQEIYSNCIYYLGYTPFAASAPRFEGYSIRHESEIEFEKLKLGYEQLKLGYEQLEFEHSRFNSEFNNEKLKWLNLLAVYHPFRGTAEFDNFLTRQREHRLTVADVTELAARDPRLQSDIGKSA
jgi:hypothetical protein